MEFECQKANEIGLANTNPNCLGSHQKEQLGLGLGQTDFLNNERITTVKSEESEISIQKLNAKSAFSRLESEDLVPVNEGSGKNCRSITDLPRALISEILDCLDPKDLGVVSCVSTLLYKLGTEHKAWKDFYSERWGCPVGLAGVGGSEEKSWKELFGEKEFRSRMFMGKYNVEAMYGHAEAVRTLFVLSSKKLVFSSGYDQIVRMWDMEEGLAIASSRPLGCTIRAVAADTRLLVAAGTDGFIHGWRAEEGNPHLFDIMSQNQNLEFRLWEHEGPITCLSLDFNMLYSGSWDMTIRIWDRTSLKCLKVLMHNDWVWSLAPRDTTVASAAGSDVYVWDTNIGEPLSVINDVHAGNAYSLARSHTGKLLFTGGADGVIHMYDIIGNDGYKVRKVASWAPHVGAVNSLAFEFPWLVSASGDGKLSLIDVRKLMKTSRPSSEKPSKFSHLNNKDIEPPQRMFHGFGPNLFSVGIGLDRIVCGGEDGTLRSWNFSQALEIEQRVRTLRGLRLENRRRRGQLQSNINSTGGRSSQCSVAARKKQITGDKNSWHDKRRVSGKLKA